MLQFRISCGRCATGFLQTLPFVELWTLLHLFRPHTVEPRYNEVPRYEKKCSFQRGLRYSEDPVITNYLVNSKNIRYNRVTKLNRAEQWDIHHAKQSTDLRVNSKAFSEGQSFPIFTNESRVWSINHLYHHAVFTDCERQDKIFVIAG